MDQKRVSGTHNVLTTVAVTDNLLTTEYSHDATVKPGAALTAAFNFNDVNTGYLSLVVDGRVLER